MQAAKAISSLWSVDPAGRLAGDVVCVVADPSCAT
jgi:hypothetical protein